MTKQHLIGWIIGFFIVLAPLHFTTDYGIIMTLIQSIIGVVGAILFLEVGE